MTNKINRLNFRVTDEERLTIDSMHMEFGTGLSLFQFLRSLAVGEIEHPHFRRTIQDPSVELLERLDRLDHFLHYGATMIAAKCLTVPGDKFLRLHKEDFYGLEASIRGYNYDHETGKKTPLDDF